MLPLFDSGEADSFLFYVMPYVEGESLRERLDRERQLPVEEALRITIDVAGALDYAHRQGVVHRDIKPANILLQDGRPLVADFGIALAVSAAGEGRLTETGLSLGTPYYMSPEQATADRDPGPESDVYSLGCVLYEMLSGEPPFTGSSAQAILGKIVTGEPEPPSGNRKTVPTHVDWVVLKSLAKLPADRFGSAAKMAEALASPGVVPIDPRGSAGRSAPGRLERLAWGVAVLAVLIWGLSRGAESREGEPGEVVRLSLRLPDSVPMAFIGAAALGNGRRAFAISEDGDRLVYVGLKDSETRLYLRDLGSYEITAISGTESAYGPFFSPNGLWVGFFVGNQLKKVRVDGGEPVLIAEATNSVGADWSTDGRIVFGHDEGGALRIVSDQGELLSDVGSLVTEPIDFEWPVWLPSGRILLGGNVVDPETGAVEQIGDPGPHAVYQPGGYVIGTARATLHAMRYDPARPGGSSATVPVLGGVREEVYGQGQWDISGEGTLVYAEGRAVAEGPLTWIEADGSRTRLDLPRRFRGSFELSPGDTRLAVLEFDASGSDVWVYDLTNNRPRQLTVDGSSRGPLHWSPDGREILFHRDVVPVAPFATTVDAGAEARPLLTGTESSMWIYSWTPAGFGTANYGATGLAVVEPGSEERREITTDATAWGLAISPSGDAVAYTSARTGEYHNFVESFPVAGERRQVSVTGGAEEPRWSDDGRRLFYRNGRRIMAVDVTTSPTLEVGSPEVIFEGDFVNVGGRSYEVSADGRRVLILEDRVVTTTTLHVVQGWLAEVERLLSQSETPGG